MNQDTEDGASKWIKAGRCSAGNCVEIQRTLSGARIRDSKQNGFGDHQPIIALTSEEWDEFAAFAASERTHSSVLELKRHAEGVVTLTQGDTDLRFDADEWAAFVGGLADGDFD